MAAPPRTTIEISKDYLHFNSAHFTIFSPEEREDLHGHTFFVKAFITSEINEAGLAFDYNLVKNTLKRICDGIDEKVLLPERSPWLKLVVEGEYLIAEFAGDRMPFLPRDVITLPLRNITVEELARWVQDEMLADPQVAGLALIATQIQVSSGPGQWAAASWQAAHVADSPAAAGIRPAGKMAAGDAASNNSASTKAASNKEEAR